MTKYLLILIFSLGFAFQNFAQEETFEPLGVKYPREKYILSLSLLSQLDINSPSLQVGLDIKVKEWFGIHQELGFINNWLNPFYTFIDNNYSFNPKLKNGVKYIFEPRFYPLDKDRLFGSRFFIAPSFNFRYVNVQRNEQVSRFNNAYRQQMRYDVNKLVYGGMVKVGFTTKLRKALPIQMAFGLGFRYSDKYNNLPEDARSLVGQNNFLVSAPDISGGNFHPDVHYSMLLQLHYFNTQAKKKTITPSF